MGVPGFAPGRKVRVKNSPLVEPEVQRTLCLAVALLLVGREGAKGVFQKGKILDRIDRRDQHELRRQGPLKPGKKLLFRHGTREKITLDQTASHAKPERKVLGKLESLPDETASRKIGEEKGRPHDGEGIGVAPEPSEKIGIELDLRHREIGRIVEGGVSRPEVVEGDPEAPALQLFDQPRRPRHVLEGGGFRDLEDQPVPSGLPDRLLHVGQEFLMKEMAGSDI
jgi:hypothetical protein